MDDLKRPTFWITQVIALLVLIGSIAWTAGRYPDRSETQRMISEAMLGPGNPYNGAAPAIVRVVERYDRDRELLDAKLDEMSQRLQDLILEIRIIGRKR
jgi:hypothetical protein